MLDSAHIAREAMETLHGNLMETEAAMETQAAPVFFLAALDVDAETVNKMLSTADAQSLINYQHALGDTPLLTAWGHSAPGGGSKWACCCHGTAASSSM